MSTLNEFDVIEIGSSLRSFSFKKSFDIAATI